MAVTRMAINRQVDISGSATPVVSIKGNISNNTVVSGNVTVRNKVYKELYFARYSDFPQVGTSDTLYVDTSSDGLFYWKNGTYWPLGVTINDARILENATWSSQKITTEIDEATPEALSNFDILEIL